MENEKGLGEIEQRAIIESIEQARLSKSENSKVHPLVGAVVVKDGEILASAHRGEIDAGEHAEYTALERKLHGDSIAGCTIFTTLEPCTHRNPPKVPCVERLIERKVSTVWIGMVDPNRKISGLGIRKLREANVEVKLFPAEYCKIVEELNRDFIRDQKRLSKEEHFTDAEIKNRSGRGLDEWYKTVNSIYWNRNYYQGVAQTYSHLVEVIGGLSLLASEKSKQGVDPIGYLPKAIAWWMALCGKLGINSIEEMLWDKFPAICPYCKESPHKDRVCKELKKSNVGPDWASLRKLGNGRRKPKTVGDWQIMFEAIYPVAATDDYKSVFARLVEELGELSEAVRVFPAEPGYFLSEACDVFAWLMRIQNIYDNKNHKSFGQTINEGLAKSYPDVCVDCNNPICSCPPILKSTIGRIAHEIPMPRNSEERLIRFMSQDAASEKFGGGL